MRITFTLEDVTRVYDEVDRRIESDRMLGLFETDGEIKEYRKAMMQGVYGTLMVLADNWSEVRCRMIDRIEDERHWIELGYEEGE